MCHTKSISCLEQYLHDPPIWSTDVQGVKCKMIFLSRCIGHKPGVVEDDFIWGGGTKEIRRLRTDRMPPQGHGEGEGAGGICAPSHAKREAKLFCFKYSFKCKATLKNKVTYHFSSQSACSLLYLCNAAGMHYQH